MVSTDYRRSLIRGSVGICLLLVALCALPRPVAAQATSDVRVLIDVSGSMKRNDPKNLRVPALRLLVELLPEGTRSGVWMFAQGVDMSVPLGNVNKTWRDKALAAADQIHSRGLFTNIEDALRKASVDWKQPDPHYRRHMILLTDGMVDIAKDPRENAQSRQRILQELLPALQQADVSIHTIALSNEADFDLLQALSSASGGAFEKVTSAEQLQRIFLRLFEKSVGADSLPIENNRFMVDKNVSDITVLLFLAKDSPATQLTLPTKHSYTEKQHPDTVQWHHEEGYDLITIRNPEAGQWSMQAKVDPDNRVLVVTNLRLKIDKLPNSLLLGDSFELRARLLEESKTVTNPSLLDKTQFILKLSDEQNKPAEYPLKDDGLPPDSLKADGVYSLSMDKLQRAGAYELLLQVKSLTFAREQHHNLHVYDSPAEISISQIAPDKPFHVSIQPHAGLIRPETVSMQVRLPAAEPLTVAQTGDTQWAIDIPVAHANQIFTLTLAATRYDDKPLKMEFEQPLAVTEKPHSLAIKATTPASPPDSHVATAAQAPEVQAEEDTDQADEPAPEPHRGFDWKIVGGIVLGVNALIFGLGWVVFRKLRKRRQQQVQKDVKEMQV
ncbi:MAG: VWA domain-containing protein [Gammaproteobacteria bacterium]|nr:VWA domain-containing protein [Gammaproteobacteria bacterium]